MTNKSKIAVFGAPIDLSTFGHEEGTAKSPDKLREMGLIRILESNRYSVIKNKNIDVEKSKSFGKVKFKFAMEILSACATLKTEAKRLVANGKFLLVIGGDHSVSLGSISGILAAKRNVGIIWLDAHPDLNTPQTTTSGNLHGMSLAGLLGKINHPMVNSLIRKNKLAKDNLVLFGLKNVDIAEQGFIDSQKLKTITLWDIERDGIDTSLKRAIKLLPGNIGHLHVSFDIDVVDEMWALGVGIATRGGLSYREIIYAANFFERHGINSLDVVELNPEKDNNDMMSLLVMETIMAFLGISYGPYERFREMRGLLK